MAHYALLNMANIVTDVIVGPDENDSNTNWELYYQDVYKQVVKRTSFNTIGGVHLEGGTPFRKNYAGRFFTYDYGRDAFIPPQPFSSWTLNEDTCLWDPPTPCPIDDNLYDWDEDGQEWKLRE